VSFGSIYYRALVDTKVDTTVTSISFTLMSRYLIMVWQIFSYVLHVVPGGIGLAGQVGAVSQYD
jgi:hypothetical protein